MNNFLTLTQQTFNTTNYCITFVMLRVFQNCLICKKYVSISVPAPPERINVVIKSSRSVLVSWLPPKPSNGEVERYHVYSR